MLSVQGDMWKYYYYVSAFQYYCCIIINYFSIPFISKEEEERFSHHHKPTTKQKTQFCGCFSPSSNTSLLMDDLGTSLGVKLGADNK